jgi:electron transfer flavoprotein alpha subunit
MGNSVLVFAEFLGGAFRKGSLEALTLGRDLADQFQGPLVAVTAGEGVAAAAPSLARFGVQRVLVADGPAWKLPVGEAAAPLLHEAVKKTDPAVVLLSAGTAGRELAPRLAQRLDVGCAVDCTAVRFPGGKPEIVRPVYAGKALATVTLDRPPFVISLRPNAVTVKERPGAPITAETLAPGVDLGSLRAVLQSVAERPVGRPELPEADVVVSGGRGLKAPEHFKMIEELADALGAAVGASRAVVDAGWRPHREQVGQTGKTVAPQLYFAIGISGAIQHLAGMSSSKCIVAVNKDPNAPIFQLADYGIVGDAFEIVPVLTAEIRKLRRS